MRTVGWILSVVLLFSSVGADDLKGLVRKTEGKKTENKPSQVVNPPARSEEKPAPVLPSKSDENKPLRVVNPSASPGEKPAGLPDKGGANKPIPVEPRWNPATTGLAQERGTPSSTGSVNDLFRKASTSEDRPGGIANEQYYRLRDRSKDPMYYPPNSPDNLPHPARIGMPSGSNRPVPLSDGNLPGLVARTEGLNPSRWQRFRDLRFSVNWSYGYYCYDPIPRRVCYTPYWYYDPCPPFIPVFRVVYVQRPVYVYIEVPVDIPTVYYLERPQREPDSKELLIGDLRRAWIYRDITLIERYVRPNSYIAVYLDGRYAYSISSQDYIDLTRDALRAIKTDRIAFDRVFKRGEDQLVLYGIHEYLDEAGQSKRIYIMYTLERDGSRWYLIEVGSSTNPLK